MSSASINRKVKKRQLNTAAYLLAVSIAHAHTYDDVPSRDQRLLCAHARESYPVKTKHWVFFLLELPP